VFIPLQEHRAGGRFAKNEISKINANLQTRIVEALKQGLNHPFFFLAAVGCENSVFEFGPGHGRFLFVTVPFLL
jgi:hypothetical protein